MKTIAFYLPQFHTIPENDKWWGKGFTEWVNVKKAKPLFEGHKQPKVPLNKNYYDLSNIEVMKWQTDLAKKHGIYGFCFYHYWFDGHLLLEKPVENYLFHKEIEFPYCICWPNEQWTNAWVSGENKVLIEQRYGDREAWKRHFDYLLPFFRDNRYIYKDGKPILVIYRPELIDDRKQMLDYWNELAKEAGFKGLCMMFQRPDAIINDPKIDMTMFDYCIEYQPYTAFLMKSQKKFARLKRIRAKLGTFLEKRFNYSAANLTRLDNGPSIRDYDEVWEAVLDSKPLLENSIPCAFVNWDNTPRRGERGSVFKGVTCEKFESYLEKLINKTKYEYHQDMMFIFAWNEWAEGGYLEPDEENGYGYLEAVHTALQSIGEIEQIIS